jgi:hypothetical protein
LEFVIDVDSPPGDALGALAALLLAMVERDGRET